MKKWILSLGCIMLVTIAPAQLKTTKQCPAFTIDILDGKVNDLRSTATVGQIKETFPCFSGAEAEASTAKCGGGVYYKDRDIYFYTARDYVEIGPKFKGIPLRTLSFLSNELEVEPAYERSATLFHSHASNTR